MTQHEALRLVERLRGGWGLALRDEAAAELRRLHAECNDLAHQLNESNERNGRIIAQRDALLAVLKELQESASYWSEYDVPLGIVDRINAAIAKAEEKQ